MRFQRRNRSLLHQTADLQPTAVAFSSQRTNPANGKVLGLNGEVSSINTGRSFMMLLPEPENPRTVSISSASATAYQGINNFSDLTVRTSSIWTAPFNRTGSLVATRIRCRTPLPPASSADHSCLYRTSSRTQPTGTPAARRSIRDNFVLGGQYFEFTNAIFQISGQLPNLQELPFAPSSLPPNMVPGEYVNLSASTVMQSGGFPTLRSRR